MKFRKEFLQDCARKKYLKQFPILDAYMIRFLRLRIVGRKTIPQRKFKTVRLKGRNF
ncbi:hypothetical protein LEP1GSC047_3982 [Leptospira inadai serovar Lyme str. 10]|uniref:Uncharacterized protein n=1 Tax=Leptospira inadai serovar Lyme str. 10 TaxID=1049790 RepID=V6HXD9_9LEPT|nr:hypothetical protein LEP1GSC047_3982 [Leptospira inadai serovar Lyme str. 10]